MHYIDFENANLKEKAKFVWDNAMFIESIVHYNTKVNLYSVGKQFIEVYYSPVTNDIVRIIFADDHNLKKYISKINLVL